MEQPINQESSLRNPQLRSTSSDERMSFLSSSSFESDKSFNLKCCSTDTSSDSFASESKKRKSALNRERARADLSKYWAAKNGNSARKLSNNNLEGRSISTDQKGFMVMQLHN